MPGRKLATLIVVAAAALASGCATPSSSSSTPASMRDTSIDFAKFRTFGWVNPAGAAGEPAVGLLDQNIRGAITAELSARGYVAATEKPDLLIAYETTRSDRVGSNPERIGIGVGSWGGNVGGSVSVGSPSVRNYQQGSLVIHAVDAARNAEVWQGQVSSKLTKGSTEKSAIYTAVGKAMKDFPTRPAGQ